MNDHLLIELDQNMDGSLRMHFGEMHEYEWIGKSGKHISEKGIYTIYFFDRGWRFLKVNEIFLGYEDHFVDPELTKLAEETIENVISIISIERLNKHDYRVFFSNNIILETFGLSSNRVHDSLYLTDKNNKGIDDINLFCTYNTFYEK
jgi:hypothetical protein